MKNNILMIFGVIVITVVLFFVFSMTFKPTQNDIDNDDDTNLVDNNYGKKKSNSLKDNKLLSQDNKVEVDNYYNGKRKFGNIDTKIDVNNEYHNGVKVSDLLNDENYKKVGINPNDYKTVEDFYKDYSKKFPDSDLNLADEEFVIGLKNGNLTSYTKVNPKNESQNKAFKNDPNKKNLFLLDLYSSAKNKTLYGGNNSKTKGIKVRFDSDRRTHPRTNELNKMFGTKENVYKNVKDMKVKKNLTTSEKELLGYSYDLIGNYEEGQKVRNQLCITDKNNCMKDILITYEGKVETSDFKPIEGVKIELLNNPKFSTKTDSKGNYSLVFKYYPFGHLRFKASKFGFSDGYNTIKLDQTFPFIDDGKFKTGFNFNLNVVGDIFDTENAKIVDLKRKKGTFKYYNIKSEKLDNEYFIPVDGLYFEDGKKYTGNSVSLELFHFSREDNMRSLLNSDAFSPDYGFLGNTMITYGMPYIKVHDKVTNKELFAKKSNPMILRSKMKHIETIYNDEDKFGNFSKDDLKKILDYSNSSTEEFPITFDYIVKNGFDSWPPWWSMNRTTGIWDNAGQKLLDLDGNMELPMYQLNDEI